MSRVQLALNVADLGAALSFYSTLFAAKPAKVRPGYANFAIDDPPLKLVLVEDATREPGSLNHLGVEVATTEEVAAAAARLRGEGLPTATEEGVTCCYALQDKVWVHGPGGEPWEFYTVLADAEMEKQTDRGGPATSVPAPGCCGSPADLGGPATSEPAPGCCGSPTDLRATSR